MEEALELELRRAERKKLPVGIIMLDIDHFKAFNDGFGHAAGTNCYGPWGPCFGAPAFRRRRLSLRGEEFTLILPEPRCPPHYGEPRTCGCG